MRRTALGRVLVLCLLAAGVCASGQQLLNPSFEDPEPVVTDVWGVVTNPWGDLAAHWGRWGNWMNRETFWAPTRSGTGMIGYHHWRIEESGTSGLYQDISNTPPSARCVFSVYAYKDLSTDADSIELRLERFGGFETVASNVYPVLEMGQARWIQLSVSGVNTNPGMRVLIMVTPKAAPGRNGCIKFDDAEFVVAPADGEQAAAPEPRK